MFGRHQPDIVAASGEYPSEMMGAAAGLHPDDARTKLLRQPDQSLAPHLAPHHNRPRRIQPDDAANILAKVDPKHRDIHPFLLLISRRAYDAGRRGGPFHKISPPLFALGFPTQAKGAPLEIWLQGEARLGPQGALTRVWAKRGTRP